MDTLSDPVSACGRVQVTRPVLGLVMHAWLLPSAPPRVSVTLALAAACCTTCVLQRSEMLGEQGATAARLMLAVPAVAPLLAELLGTLSTVPAIVTEAEAAAPPSAPGSSTRVSRPRAS